MRYVIQLPVTAANLHTAIRLARVVARTLRFLPRIDPRATTVVEDGDPGVRHRVFCDLTLPGGRGCLLRAGHDGGCSRRLRRSRVTPVDL
ncbi:hypothetical protein [Plantactinospora sonchi]|uniref:Uncharacterized protein n=1 Tax=Plantactinospora sonchi TaxID=1544735 RepID=A0ABU7RYN5_9ACTN